MIISSLCIIYTKMHIWVIIEGNYWYKLDSFYFLSFFQKNYFGGNFIQILFLLKVIKHKQYGTITKVW